MPHHETAEWLGCSIDQMNREHDPLHRRLCGWAGVESQSMRIAAGEILGAREHRLADLEEAAVLNVQRWMVALRKEA